MANAPKKKSVTSTRAQIEQMRAEQRSKDRRRTLALITIVAVVALGLVAVAVIPIVKRHREASTPISAIGASAAAAGCGVVQDDPADGLQQHVGPGTSSPGTTHVNYPTNPPSHGSHFAVPAGIDRHFYASTDTPPVEQLVHNLEHGYTIVWYDSTVSGDEVAQLKSLATRISASVPKFIVASWDESRGDFPEGHVAISHWSRDAGHREYCGKVSGEAVQTFVNQFPYSDAPEPGAA